MRNLFDQYKGPENRLSHALAVCLDEDRRMLREFIAWAGVSRRPNSSRLVVIEQSLPGDPPEIEEESERKGLPDIIIHDDETWCLVVESKISARLSKDQLVRHETTLRGRGFEEVHVLALTKDQIRTKHGAKGRTWTGLYEWLGTSKQSGPWPQRLREYLRVAETRLAHDEYLKEGTLTMFDGFPFSEKQPYSYGEARRLIKLVILELRKSKKLERIGMDPRASGRGMIPGRAGRGVWDYLSLKDRPGKEAFTSYPHLTLVIHEDRLGVAVVIPNSVIPAVRKRIAELGPDELSEMHARILRKAKPLLEGGAWIDAGAEQRHFQSRSKAATPDAKMNFKLETSLASRATRIKHQPEWVELFVDLMKHKRSNIQFGYGVNFPWTVKGLHSRKSLGLIVDAWLAFEPLLDCIRERRRRSTRRFRGGRARKK